jgi:hypothetical protein
MATKTYAGSCHCGAVRFEADIDLAEGGGKCNCTICRKARNWSASVKPEAFRLLSDPAETTDYSRHGMVHWLFCKTCGVRPYSHGDIPEVGGAFVSVQLACLDDIDDEALAAAPVRYCNGRDNDWWHEPSAAEMKFL